MRWKRCTQCGVVKAVTEFYSHPNGLPGECKKCHGLSTRKREHDNRPRRRLLNAAAQRRANDRRRVRALEILGNSCSRCGFTDSRALQIDHRQGDGAHERRAIGHRGVVSRVLAGEINDYQLLCANCNWIKRAENSEVSGRKEVV